MEMRQYPHFNLSDTTYNENAGTPTSPEQEKNLISWQKDTEWCSVSWLCQHLDCTQVSTTASNRFEIQTSLLHLTLNSFSCYITGTAVKADYYERVLRERFGSYGTENF